jgi:hypothetical protein
MPTVLENRRKWIELLKKPDTKKARGILVSRLDPEARCCLGHGCESIGLTFDPVGHTYDGASHCTPVSAIEALGLWDFAGTTHTSGACVAEEYISLAAWNDESDVSPQEIGAYLETVIMGGFDTPFKPIEDLSC